MFLINLTTAQIEGTTSNNAFYFRGYSVLSATVLAQLITNGATIDANLANCVELCRMLPNCKAWQYYASNCILYSEILSFNLMNNNYYVGHKSMQPFWRVIEDKDIFYYENILSWRLQGNVPNRAVCARNCFFNTPSCKSWFQNDLSKDCYHSVIDYYDKLHVNMTDVYTGTVLFYFN